MKLKLGKKMRPIARTHRIGLIKVDAHANPAHELEARHRDSEAPENGKLVARPKVGDQPEDWGLHTLVLKSDCKARDELVNFLGGDFVVRGEKDRHTTRSTPSGTNLRR